MINFFKKTKTEKEDFLKSHPEIKKVKNIFLPTFLYGLGPFIFGIGFLLGGILSIVLNTSPDVSVSGGGIFMLVLGIIAMIMSFISLIYQKSVKTGFFIHLKDDNLEMKQDFQKSKMSDKAAERETAAKMKITQEEEF